MIQRSWNEVVASLRQLGCTVVREPPHRVTLYRSGALRRRAAQSLMLAVLLSFGCAAQKAGPTRISARTDRPPRPVGRDPYECEADSECPVGRVCIAYQITGYRFCEWACWADSACPKGSVCLCPEKGCTYLYQMHIGSDFYPHLRRTGFCVRP